MTGRLWSSRSRIAVVATIAALAAGRPGSAEPTIYVESIAAPPGSMSIPVRFFGNADLQFADFGCIDFIVTQLAPASPASSPISYEHGICIDRTPFVGPGIAGADRLFPSGGTSGEGAVYQLHLEQIHGGPYDQNGQLIPLKTVNGILLVRQKPVVKGDLLDNGVPSLSDAVLSLRLAVGLDPPTPYDRVAGDYNRDGQLTIEDTILILRHFVLALP